MRIAADLSFFIADQRGMGRVVRSILKELLLSNEDDFIFFVRRAEDIAQVNDWVHTVNPSVRMKTILARELSDLSVDVCWYPWNRVDVTPKSGQRIVTINDVNPFVFPYRSIWRRWDQHKDERQFRRAVAAADLIVTISDFSRREIIRYLGADEKKITVMPMGVDRRWFASTATQDTCQEERAVVSHGPQLLYVGADDERKNLRRLMETMEVLHQKLDCPATLICCGVGRKARDKYIPRLREAGIEGSVEFAGFVSDEELRQMYDKADLFVFPSLYEGFGLPILEAMAAGLPVVTSRAASLPEVGGDAVVYCDAGDSTDMAAAIRDTWENFVLRDRLRERGIVRAAQFTWSRAARVLRDIFAEETTGRNEANV